MHRHSTLHMYRPRIFRITLSLTSKTDRATVHSRLSCWPELSQSAAQWLVGFSLRHPCPSFSSYQQPAQQQSDRYHQQCITHPHACTCVSQLCSAHVHVHVIHMHKHVYMYVWEKIHVLYMYYILVIRHTIQRGLLYMYMYMYLYIGNTVYICMYTCKID